MIRSPNRKGGSLMSYDMTSNSSAGTRPALGGGYWEGGSLLSFLSTHPLPQHLHPPPPPSKDKSDHSLHYHPTGLHPPLFVNCLIFVFIFA